MEPLHAAIASLGACGLGAFIAYLWIMHDRLIGAIEMIEGADERMAQLEDALQQIAGLMEALPQLMPQFAINNNPLQPLIEAFAQKMFAPQLQVGQDPVGPDNAPPQ